MIYKKALSPIISVILIIALSVVAAGIILVMVRNMADDRLGKSEACFDTFEKITLNDEYTCYNLSGERMQFSLSRGEISIDELLISISTDESSVNLVLSDTNLTSLNITNYPTGNQGVILPLNNSGLTYFAEQISEKPTLIQIAPVIGGFQCEVTDKISTIVYCV